MLAATKTLSGSEEEARLLDHTKIIPIPRVIDRIQEYKRGNDGRKCLYSDACVSFDGRTMQ